MTLPTVDEVFAGKTMKAADLVQPRLLTITHIEVRDFKDKNDNVTKKYVLSFEEDNQDFVCNKTNAKFIAKYYGSAPDAWINKKIVLYKADVEFGGNIVEGIRVRMPKGATPPAPVKVAGKYDDLNPPPQDFDDEIPF